MFSMKVHPIIVQSKRSDLEYIAEMIEQGRLRTVIDRVYPITAVADAQRYSATGRAKGKIVLSFGL